MLGLAALFGFGAFAWAARLNPYFWYDPPLTRSLQALPLPLDAPVRFYAWMLGLRQLGLAGAGILFVLLLNRRGGVLMAAGALSAVPYVIFDALVHRPRPSPGLVHVVAATPSHSFPSGHAVFFTWFLLLLVETLGHGLPLPLRWTAWALAAFGIALTAVCRVWAGAHWPSDVAAGLLLGLGWTLLVIAGGRRRPRAAART